MKTLPLSAYAGRHAGQDVIVCGCGTSLATLAEPQRHVTIGVNDVGRLFDPTYLVVVNPPSQLRSGRFQFVKDSNARALFTQLDLGPVRPPVVRFRLGQYGGTETGTGGVLHYTQNSPYVATCLAALMGARRIGLIGVDLTEDHFFARTGRHALAGRLREIDGQYGKLAAALARQGVQLVNLSPISRLASLPRMRIGADGEWVGGATPPSVTAPAAEAPRAGAADDAARRRVFFVNYRFLSCGDVFRDGLRHAAEELGIQAEGACWDDPALPGKVQRFAPDLLFVVHGRSFARRWGRTFAGRRTAVWLLDEPYEVDDTSSFSSAFTHVFVNDPATLARHRNAHYLPVCHDPRVHAPGAEERRYRVGFVGGVNSTRDRMLAALGRRGLLDYVVGGPWRDAGLRRICLSSNVPPARTAELYRSTRIVVNVFRDIHHFNRHGVPGVALNPRVYEALACGALVVSEKRPEIEALVPELPTFTNEGDLVGLVEDLLSDPVRMEEVRAASARRLAGATYTERLRSVMSLIPLVAEAAAPPVAPSAAPRVLEDAWDLCPPIDSGEQEGEVVLRREWDRRPGSERGLASRAAFDEVDLSFEVLITPGSSFIAKVHQADRLNQSVNSYHLLCHDTGAYLARHNHVLHRVEIARGRWQRLRITCGEGALSLHRDGALVCRVPDGHLRRGHAFLGLRGGEVRLRNVRLQHLETVEEPAAPPVERAIRLVEAAASTTPRVSIVTTVYDRTECLRRCIRSVKALAFRDYEHIVVSDHPPAPEVEEIARIVREEDDGRISHHDLPRRFNNWGIAPAAAGLRLSRGEFVCFLSDDNGYLPDHMGTLVDALDRDLNVGFVYSSCLYGGRKVLRHPVPRAGAIDLGQPLFRRELFARHLGDDLPFRVIAWDWALIDMLIRKGVRWKHVDRTSFVFRLAAYPQLVPA